MQEVSTHKEQWTLKDYAREINREYESATNSILRIGAWLNEVKAILPHGRFMPWVDENCSFNIQQANKYMLIEKNKDVISKPPTSLKVALREIEESKSSQITSAEVISKLRNPLSHRQ